MKGIKNKKQKENCCFIGMICFHQVLFKECYYNHTPQQVTRMHRRWGDMRHNTRRQMQAQGFKQQYLECERGMNCIFLFRGVCYNKHSAFDEQFKNRIQKKLLKTQCPNEKECNVNLCFYYHQKKINIIGEHNGKPCNMLVLNPAYSEDNPEYQQDKRI